MKEHIFRFPGFLSKPGNWKLETLVITYNHMKNSFYFIQICYSHEGLTALDRKRSIFITICFTVKTKQL